MTAQVLEQPLSIVCTFSSGKSHHEAIPEGNNKKLAKQLALALSELVHPHGRVNSTGSLLVYTRAIAVLLRWLDDTGFSGGISDLSSELVSEFLAAQPYRVEHAVRRLMLAFGTEIGDLPDGVLDLVKGRCFNPRPRRRDQSPLKPYSETEWERLRTHCEGEVATSYAEFRRAVDAIGRGTDPAIDGWSWENSCWLVSRLGPTSTNLSVGRMFGLSEFETSQRQLVVPARTALFPQTAVTTAYMLLFAIYSGIVPDGVTGLGVKDLDWAGDGTILLSYIKARTSGESVTLSRKSVKLLEQWMSHSARLRQFAPESVGRR